MVQLTSADGHTFDAYEAGDGDRALIVVQEIFGVNPHIRSVTDRAAEAGFRAIAPAFFDRVEKNVELSYEGDDFGAGIGFAGKLDWDNTMADVAAAIEHVRAQGATKVGITGFCWGGTTTWLAAAKSNVDAAVGYYGGGIHSFIAEQPKVPTMLHFGELDAHIPMEGVREVEAAHPGVTVHTYNANHGFHCDARADYDQPSAALAWTRTLDFFAMHL
ncbi:MAG: carboxymethylenebutenolidase [Acidimicrobiales bacterium]|jgi:carboxymethylenebutenolidase